MGKHTYGYLLVVAVCIYAIGFGPWGVIPWVYPSEIFPMDVKEKAMSTSVFSQWIANFLIAFLVVQQVHALGAWGTLAFYAVCCGLVFLYVSSVCQRFGVCAWRTWKPSLEPE